MSPTLFGYDNTPVTSGATGRASLARPTEKYGCALLRTHYRFKHG